MAKRTFIFTHKFDPKSYALLRLIGTTDSFLVLVHDPLRYNEEPLLCQQMCYYSSRKNDYSGRCLVHVNQSQLKSMLYLFTVAPFHSGILFKAGMTMFFPTEHWGKSVSSGFLLFVFR